MCYLFYLKWECGHRWKGAINKCQEYIQSDLVGAGKECRESARCILGQSTTHQKHPCFACMFPDVFPPQTPGKRIINPLEYSSLSQEDIPTVPPTNDISLSSNHQRRSLEFLQERYGDPIAITKEVLQSERVRDLARPTIFNDQILNAEDLEWLGMVLQCLTYRIRKGLVNHAFSDPRSTYRKALFYAYSNLDRKHAVALLYRKCAERMDRRGPLCRPVPLDKLPVDAKNCLVCLQALGKVSDDGEVEYPVQLPCKHVFGHKCVENWVTDRKRQSCPVCRFAFRKDEYILPGEINPHSYRDEIQGSSPAWMRRFRNGVIEPDEFPEEGWADYPAIP